VSDFRRRVTRQDVAFFSLRKPPGHGFRVFPALYRLFRALRPAIAHTRNLAALEASFPAWLARVPVCIHGEHGRDVTDLDGSNRRYRLIRRAYRPFVNHYVTVSGDLERYLTEDIGVDAGRVTRIVNGVDTERFHPRIEHPQIAGCPFADPSLCIVGTIGRLQAVKHQTLLAEAFVRLLERSPSLRSRLRLVIVGEGPLRATIEAVLARGGVSELAWLPGARNDVPELLRSFDVFVLPSLAEGISNTILEAMATGLPVVATDVGGNRELIDRDVTGMLVASDDVDALADAIGRYTEPATGRPAGLAGRRRVEDRLGLDAMVARYARLYDELLTKHHRQAYADRVGSAGPERVTRGSH